MDIDTISTILVSRLLQAYPETFCSRYKIDIKEVEDLENWETVELIGRRRGFLISGGEVDFERTAKMLVDEFRSGAIGRITLEAPRNA